MIKRLGIGLAVGVPLAWGVHGVRPPNSQPEPSISGTFARTRV